MAALRQWYRRDARDLPWRHTTDPYGIWVSEAMLQQTQVATVIPYYERWMAHLPDLRALAAAQENDVLLLWEGLGYYSRARNLHRAAQQVEQQFDGRVPRQPELFGGLPGVGPYTRAAVLSIAFDAPLAAVDGNVKRVLARLIALPRSVDQGKVVTELQRLAQQLLPRRGAGVHNQAMMELGAMICTPRAPDCASCPLRRACQAHANGDPTAFPVRSKRAAVPHQHLGVAVVRHQDQFLLYRRPYGGMLAGLWDFPAEPLPSGDSKALRSLPRIMASQIRERFGLKVRPTHSIAAVTHAYTHLKVTLHGVVLEACGDAALSYGISHRETLLESQCSEGTTWRMVPRADLTQHPMPRASHKVLATLGMGCRVIRG